MIIMMFRSLTNQNNISLNNSVINMCTNSTTYIMIGLDINHYLLQLFKVHSQLGFQKSMFHFKKTFKSNFGFLFYLNDNDYSGFCIIIDKMMFYCINRNIFKYFGYYIKSFLLFVFMKFKFLVLSTCRICMK
jgi:hypothetical protein